MSQMDKWEVFYTALQVHIGTCNLTSIFHVIVLTF
jgi:hypothetical protein